LLCYQDYLKLYRDGGARTFVFLAGTSVYLQLMCSKRRHALSKFLITRGL